MERELKSNHYTKIQIFNLQPINLARTRYMSMRVRGLDFGAKLCAFEGRKYPVGSRLYHSDFSNHQAAPCVDCECRVPPDFTCVQRKDCLYGENTLIENSFQDMGGSGGRKRQINS